MAMLNIIAPVSIEFERFNQVSTITNKVRRFKAPELVRTPNGGPRKVTVLMERVIP